MADSGYSILDVCDGSLVNIDNMDNLVKWFRPRKTGFFQYPQYAIRYTIYEQVFACLPLRGWLTFAYFNTFSDRNQQKKRLSSSNRER